MNYQDELEFWSPPPTPWRRLGLALVLFAVALSCGCGRKPRTGPPPTKCGKFPPPPMTCLETLPKDAPDWVTRLCYMDTIAVQTGAYWELRTQFAPCAD